MTELVMATVYRDATQQHVERLFATIDSLRQLDVEFTLRYVWPDLDRSYHERIELVTNKP